MHLVTCFTFVNRVLIIGHVCNYFELGRAAGEPLGRSPPTHEKWRPRLVGVTEYNLQPYNFMYHTLHHGFMYDLFMYDLIGSCTL